MHNTKNLAHLKRLLDAAIIRERKHRVGLPDRRRGAMADLEAVAIPVDEIERGFDARQAAIEVGEGDITARENAAREVSECECVCLARTGEERPSEIRQG
jgi:hypothetical protein